MGPESSYRAQRGVTNLDAEIGGCVQRVYPRPVYSRAWGLDLTVDFLLSLTS